MNGIQTDSAREEVLQMMRRLEREPAHVLHVARLALQLFDQLAALHGCSGRERFLIEAAALLHDTGWSVSPSGKGHHKESARLIQQHAWRAITGEEARLIAQIARYHRKSVPKADHEEFAALSDAEQETVRKLAALLRVADGLDRSHQSRVERIEAAMSPERILLTLHTADSAQAEIAAASKKADLARAVFGRDVIFNLKTEDE